MPDELQVFTERDVDDAIAVADRLTGELNWNMSDSEALTDFINVYVSAFKSALRDPLRQWTLDAVLEENWGDSFDPDDYDSAAQWVRNWH